MNYIIASDLVTLCKEKHVTLGSIESMTGGKIAAAITSVAGSSAVFIGGVVSYNVSIKENVVGVDKDIVDKYGVVSKEVAIEMAKKGRELLNVDYCVSVTGNAGPSQENDNKGVGTVHIGVSYADETISKEFHYSGSRIEIQNSAVNDAILLVSILINEKN